MCHDFVWVCGDGETMTLVEQIMGSVEPRLRNLWLAFKASKPHEDEAYHRGLRDGYFRGVQDSIRIGVALDPIHTLGGERKSPELFH